MPLFTEFHNRNFLMSRLSSSETIGPLILIVIYFPPDERRWESVSHLARVVEFLKSRYSSFNLVGYGDLNADLSATRPSSSTKRIRAALTRLGLRTHKSPGELYTRLQGDHRSYLDYFLTINAQLTAVQIGNKVGTSDHLPISSSVLNCSPVLRSKRLVFSKSQARVALSYLMNPKAKTKPPLRLFNGLSAFSKSLSIIYEPSPKSYFRTIDSVESELKKAQPDWYRVTKSTLQCRGLEFMALLEDINKARLDGLSSKFHRTVQNVLHLKDSSLFSSVCEIIDPDDHNQILFEPEKLK